MNTNEWFLPQLSAFRITKEIKMKTDHDVPFLESNIIENFFAFVFLVKQEI